MREFTGKVAVVTGAASGIGRALAERFAVEGMKMVLADFDAGSLARAESEMTAAGTSVRAVLTDVSKAASVAALAEAALETFGAIHLVCNNAGVASRPAPCWEKTLEDWEWVLGANLWGVIHGIRTFVPILLRQGVEAHVVNTASAAGLIWAPHGADYFVSKHGVVSLSESLHLELEAQGAPVKVSVLCPAFVRTAILENTARRFADRAVRPDLADVEQRYRRVIQDATPPAEIASKVLEAIREERFYVLPHPEMNPYIAARGRAILEGINPKVEAPS